MKCINPFTTYGQAFGCGQCLPCRLARRRIWKSRIMLEAMQYRDNAFVTLTYDDDHLMQGPSRAGPPMLPSLAPRDLMLFLKRLRKASKLPFRFFGVGEYGDQTFRPHYHFAAFNFVGCVRGETKKSFRGRCEWQGCCSSCSMVGRLWGKGDIEIRALDPSKCEYVARYTVKKMTKGDDARLLGRHPEFSRQSNGGGKSETQGGIGAPALPALAKSIKKFVRVQDIVDVPSALTVSHKPLPLGRYMRSKLRLALGLPEGTPDEVLRQAWYEQVLPLLKSSQTDKETVSLREAFRKANGPYEASLKSRQSHERGKL